MTKPCKGGCGDVVVGHGNRRYCDRCQLRFSARTQWSRAGVDHTWRDVLLRDPCSYCGVRTATELDHIVPKQHGGLGGWENITPACKRCNGVKGRLPLLIAMGKMRIHAEWPGWLDRDIRSRSVR